MPTEEPQDQPAPNAPRRRKLDGCARCGYPLAELADATPCPECGTLAGASRTGLLLLDAGPGFRRRTGTGLRIVAGSIALDGMIFGCGGIAASLAVATDSTDLPGTLRVALAFAALLAIPRALGWWMATHPEPRRQSCERLTHLGIGIRACVLLQLLLAVAALIGHEYAPDRLALLLPALAVCWVLGWIGGQCYAGVTARRLGADRLARHAGRLAFAPFLLVLAYPISVLLTPLTLLIDPIFGLVPTLYLASVTVAVPAGLCLIVILTVRTVGRLADALTRHPIRDAHGG